jgi:polysaccharide export outer membrane protein
LLQIIASAGTGILLTPGGGRLPQTVASAGAGVPLAPGDGGLPQTIASSSALNAPVHDIFVRLSRGGVTATIPMKTLVSDPAEDIYAQPGDVLTLVRIPQTFTVFGAAGRNDDIVFDAERITLSEALGKSQGLRDDLANPKGVFLFRYEPNSTVRALDQPVAAHSFNDSSRIAYRFDFKDANSYLLAQRFPVRDKDIIFVADAGAVQVQKIFSLLSTVTGPIVTGLLVCRQTTC